MFFSTRAQRRISIILVVIVTLGILALAMGQVPPTPPPTRADLALFLA